MELDERSLLTDLLDYQRGVLLRKVDGLTDEQARFSPVPSGTSLWGLVAHLGMVERWWFAKVVADLDVEFPWSDDDEAADPDVDWRGPEGATLADLVATYETECERSRAIVAAASLDDPTHQPREGRSVRWVLLHMIEETARHNGHADLLRELVDGSVGH